MGKNMWARVVQRGILLRETDDEAEALLLRNPNGTWELPGGKVEHGETAAESLEREIRDETGLDVTAAEPVETAVRKIRKKNRGKFAVVYRCAYEGDAVEISDEHVDFEWASRTEIGEANLKQVDEYRSLRRVIAEHDGAAERPAGRVAETDGQTAGDRTEP